MANDEEIVEVLRVLRYVGPRSWVDTQIEKRGVKGRHYINPTKRTEFIEEAILGEVPRLLNRGDRTDD